MNLIDIKLNELNVVCCESTGLH